MNNEKPAPEQDQTTKPGDAAAARSNRPATIDLKATEIKSEPAAERSELEPAAAAQDAAAQDADPVVEEAPKGGVASDPSPAREDAAHAASKRSPWSLVGVAAVAAVVFFAVGIGAGHFMSERLAGQRPATPVTAAPSPETLARIEKLEALAGTLQKEDPQLQSRLAKLEAQANAPRANDAQLMARIAAAEAAVKTLADLTATREKRNDDIAALAREARDHASSAAAAAASAQKAQASAPESRADIDALTGRLSSLEQSASKSQAELAKRLTADDAKGRFAIAALALRDSVNSGAPFAAELAAVKSLSTDPASLSVLDGFAASGVPSAASLGRELAGLMPAIWKVARKDEAQQGTFLERLQANASKIVRIRPAGDVVGDDPTSVSARIEARADHADINGALAELAKLPADARAPAEGWIKRAQARNAAIAAARNVSQSALAALAKSGS
jgi:hypothetical protein